jgi:creatinine amidohydrolase
MSKLILTLLSLSIAFSQTTREMNYISWQEFQEFVPNKIQTVILPVGTLEPHGVIPNGSDNIAPETMAKEISKELNALVAPTLNYGITGSMKAYPGAFAIRIEAYKPFVSDIIKGLAENKFKNIIILNGHGGPQTKVLHELSSDLSEKHRVRILVINWWSLVDKITKSHFKENGGHAGLNETAYIQAIVPKHVHKERYNKNMTTAYPSGTSWSASPFPSSIGLYEAGQGFPNFDMKQAIGYYQKVNAHVLNLCKDIIMKWDLAKLYQD